MTECHKRKIVDLYLSGSIDNALEEIAKGWLSDNIDNHDVDAALEKHFAETVKYKPAKAQTYRNLRALQLRLGMSKKEAIRIPIARRTSFRVAAVFIPALLISGLALNIYRNRVVPVEEAPIAEVVTDTIPVPKEEIIPVEVAVVPAPEPVIKAKPKAEAVRTDPPKPKSTVYDFEASAIGDIHKYVKLADNSTVILNDGSTFKFSSEKREAFLTGEAYFEVAQGQSLPFTVVTEHLAVNVTGTKFNITALPGKNETAVDLVAGAVNIDSKAGNIELRPKERFTLDNQSGLIKIGKAKTECWWNQPLIFDGLTMCEILARLENCYGIRINGKEKIDNLVEYTIKFSKTSTLAHILNVLHEIYPEAEYKKDGAAVTVNVNTDTDNL